MPIRACPDCLSDRLDFRASPSFRCYACGWTGKPLEFPNFTAWKDAHTTLPLVA